MNRPRMAVLVAALTVPFGAHAAGRMERTQEVQLAYAPIAGEPGCLAQGRLRLPPGWVPGGAVTLVFTWRGSVEDGRGGSGTTPLPTDAAVLEIVAGTATDCGERTASDPRDEVLAALAALQEHGAGPVVVLGFDEDAGAALGLGAGTTVGAGDLIAFCHPRSWAAEPCFCSVEGVETAITPGQFILHMRERRAAGATSAVELRAAMRHAGEVCGERAVTTSIEALGMQTGGAGPSSAPHRVGRVLRTHEGRVP